MEFDLAGEFSLGWARWSGKLTYAITHAKLARVAQSEGNPEQNGLRPVRAGTRYLKRRMQSSDFCDGKVRTRNGLLSPEDLLRHAIVAQQGLLSAEFPKINARLPPIEQVAVALGRSNIKVTQDHYNPWVRDRKLQLEADLQRAWNRDPIVLLNSKAQDTETPQWVLPN
jgi:hypothetical protein